MILRNALLGLTAVGAMLTTNVAGAVEPATDTGCFNVLVYGARGSGDAIDDSDKSGDEDLPDQNQGDYGMGATVARVYREVRDEIPLGATVGAAYVPYEAYGVEYLYPTQSVIKRLSTSAKLLRKLYTAPAGAALLADALSSWWYGDKPDRGINKFFGSVDNGTTVAHTYLIGAKARCPDTKFILAGYSQGAMVMHRLQNRLADGDAEDRAVLSSVIATILVADGDRTDKTSAHHVGTSSSQASGIRTYLKNSVPALSLPAVTDVEQAETTVDVCDQGDFVCDFNVVNGLQYSAGFRIHTQYKALSNTGVTRAVAHLSARIANATPVGSHMELTASLPSGVIEAAYAGQFFAERAQEFRVVKGALPSGLTLNADGNLAGTPSVAGNFRFTVEAFDQVQPGRSSVRRTTREEFVLQVGAAPPEQPVTLSAGARHTCAVLADGSVSCWGYNAKGQLGNGLTANSALPVSVIDLPGPARTISAGASHTCAILVDKSAYCWGANEHGQLGNGTQTAWTRPVKVSNLDQGVSSISAGTDNTCAVATDGAAKCWGDNGLAALGTGSFASSTTPVQVSGLSTGTRTIASSFGWSCAISGGGLVCWGAVASTLDPTQSNVATPFPVIGMPFGLMQIDIHADENAFIHGCGVADHGQATCWGRNSDGMLGSGSLGSQLTQVEVQGLGGPTRHISVGKAHSCALGVDEKIRCWGNDYFGQVGNGGPTTGFTSLPQPQSTAELLL